MVKMKHCCKNVVILMPEPVAEPALNGLRLNLRIVSIVMFNFASYLTIGLPLAVLPGYVHDVMGVADANDKQWYLTKLEKKVNKDTIPLMKAADNSYALYRLDIDSLRKRMGDLRFRNVKNDSGIWARDFHGAYEGQGTESRYNGFQLGYDYAANKRSVYGFFAERNISNPKYSHGSSKDHALVGGLYGTWLGDSGVYTDVVAK